MRGFAVGTFVDSGAEGHDGRYDATLDAQPEGWGCVLPVAATGWDVIVIAATCSARASPGSTLTRALPFFVDPDCLFALVEYLALADISLKSNNVMNILYIITYHFNSIKR